MSMARALATPLHNPRALAQGEARDAEVGEAALDDEQRKWLVNLPSFL